MGSIERTGNERWRARYRDPSGRQRSKTFDRRADAQRFLAKIETEVAHGGWQDPRLERIEYQDWAEEWFSTTVNLRPSTRQRDQAYLNNHILPRFGSYRLGEINPRDIRRWVSDLVHGGLAPATVKKAYQILSKSLGEAVAAGLISKSPCRGISLPKIEVEDRPVLSAQEALHLASLIDPRYRELVLLAAYSGMRWGELVALRADRVDLENSAVEVAETIVELDSGLLPASPPKTRAGRRRIPMPPAIAEELDAHLAGFERSQADLVFQAPEGGPLRKSFRGRFWVPATKKARVFPFRFHDLRHTAVSYWILCGASPKQIARWAGHSSVSVVLDRYGHLFPEADEKPMAEMDRMFREARSGLEDDGADPPGED